jgi:hypothetical protein
MHPPDDDGPPDYPLPSDALPGPLPGAEPRGNPLDRLKYGRNWSEPRVRSRAEASLVANTVAALLCFGFVAVIGVVLAAIGFFKSDNSPDQARLFVRLSWLCLVVSLALSVVLLVVGVVNPVIAWIGHVISLF